MLDLLAQRRPRRADAARNFDALVAAARDAFEEFGAEASMDEIARRAGVGNATLYRNFPTREALVETVYLTGVQDVCQYAEDLAEDDDPAQVLAEIGATNGELDALGIVLDTDPRKATKTGAAKPIEESLDPTD